MKKVILLGMLCLLGSVGFAQGVSYEQVRDKISRGTERVKDFPRSFYVKVTEPDYTNTYQQREDIIAIARSVYRANPDNPIAAYNYANILLKFGHMNGNGEVGSNSVEEAIRILEKTSARDKDSKELLLKAFEERERTGARGLTPDDYRTAAETSRSLGLLGRAADYEEIAREMESAELDQRDGRRRF